MRDNRTAPRLPGLLPPLLALLTAGCAPCRSTSSVESDVNEHLQAAYGESFVITDVRRTTGEFGAPRLFTDLFGFRAHPAADPTLEIKGNADYRGWGAAEFRDDYACAQVRSWLLDAIDSGLGPRRRLQQPTVFCTRGALPAHPPRGQPLEPGAVNVRATLAVFDEGDPVDVVQAARADLQRQAGIYAIRVRGAVTSYPPDAWPAVQAWQPRRQTRQPDESWMMLVQAQAESGNTDPPVAWPHHPALEETIDAALRALRPDARIGVWSTSAPGSKGRPFIDVRVAEPGLDLATIGAMAKRAREAVPGHNIRITGIDSPGPQGPQRAGFVCTTVCQPTTALLIDPEALR